MDERESEEQFEATDYDEDGNIILPPPPLAAAKPKRPTVAGLKKDIDDLEEIITEDVYSWLNKLDGRVNHLEVMMNDVPTTFARDVNARIDNQNAVIEALSDVLRYHIEEPTATPQPAETELEFAQPPQQRAGGTVDISGIAAVANVCLTMPDVLMICRSLKEIPALTDAERNGILNIACRSSGVILTPGLQIRAGVKFTGA